MPTFSVDAIDRAILTSLQADGRITNNDLAVRVGLSPSPCLRRVRNLEAAGYIGGYAALLDPAKLGYEITGFVRVRLRRQDKATLLEFEEAISSLHEVMECYLMTGGADYQVRILARSLVDFEDFIRNKLTCIDSVAEVSSSLALRPILSRNSVPISSKAIECRTAPIASATDMCAPRNL